MQDQDAPGESLLNQQSARTRGSSSNHSASSGDELVNWSEIFFFKVDYPVRVDGSSSIFFTLQGKNV